MLEGRKNKERGKERRSNKGEKKGLVVCGRSTGCFSLSSEQKIETMHEMKPSFRV